MSIFVKYQSFGQSEMHLTHLYIALPSTFAVLKIVDKSSPAKILDFNIKERRGDRIECLVQAGLLTLPFLSIAPAGHIS